VSRLTLSTPLSAFHFPLVFCLGDEYHRYFKQRREDIKKAIILYLELLIENEGRVSPLQDPAPGNDFLAYHRVTRSLQVLSYWESFSVEMASPSE
jgi:hypothetical protein